MCHENVLRLDVSMDQSSAVHDSQGALQTQVVGICSLSAASMGCLRYQKVLGWYCEACFDGMQPMRSS